MSSESIWLRPAPGQRQPSLSRALITRAAIELIDEEGVKSLSMRRVAQRLGVSAMTPYHYVRTKDELLELIDDAIVGELIVVDELARDDWRAALTTIAMRTREVYQRHPWRLSAISGIAGLGSPGPNRVRHREQSLAAAAMTGLGPAECVDIVVLVDSYLFGYALRATEPPYDGPDPTEIAISQVKLANERRRASGSPPADEAAVEQARAVHSDADRVTDDDGRFRRGLECLLDGIAVELERRGLEPKAASHSTAR